ncbi:hypothetical protein HJD18_08225 [Thermoleophilia bacterium SCSIO 60948]|nr:hypothetical protein HJD18_08225 [Thermoleophilia bacterium SCSIO 60948]
MSGELTVAWDRGERIGLPAPDSETVYPEPKLTVEWTPLINPTIIDYDPSEFERPDPGSPDPYGEPALFVPETLRASRLRSDGLRFGIRAEAEATIRARLVAIIPQERGKPKQRTISKVLTSVVGADREQLRLRLDAGGRRFVRRDPDFRARVEVIARYEGQKPYRLSARLRVEGADRRRRDRAAASPDQPAPE